MNIGWFFLRRHRQAFVLWLMRGLRDVRVLLAPAPVDLDILNLILVDD